MMRRNILAISALLIAVSPAVSQSPLTASDHVRSLVGNGLDVRAVQQRVFSEFFRKAPSGKLTLDTAETFAQREEAKKRQDTLSKILRNDLNGDGEVSAGEVDRVRKVLWGHERVSFENMVLEVDTDGDGILSGAEISNRLDEEIAEMRETARRRGLQAAAFLEFDIDGNGVVDVDELKTSIRRIGKEALKAKELRLSNSKPAPAENTRAPSQRKTASACELPEPSAEAQLVYLGGSSGTAVSSVAVGGLDEDTSFGTLEIEKGREPLYIVAAVNDSIVLHVKGATERVERLIIGSGKAKGVIGLPKEVIKFSPLRDCKMPTAYRSDSSKWIQARALLTNAFGRDVNMIGSPKIGRLAVPSGQSEQTDVSQKADGGLVIHKGNRRFRLTESGFEEMEALDTSSAYYKELIRYYLDGIANVDPEDIVTNGKAEAYDVLPRQAGIAQLMQSGALSKLSDGALSIDKPIARFPAGLAGGHSVRFVLRRGVPMPAGNRSHSSVFIEETGECLGHRC